MHGKSSLLNIDIILIGVECFLLSSSPISSEEGHVIACPHTTVTLTCTATQVGSIAWLQENRQIRAFIIDDYEGQSEEFHDDPYTLTLAVDNIITTDDDNEIGDFTSTLEVMVDDIDNGTDITCGIFQNTLHLLIYIL